VTTQCDRPNPLTGLRIDQIDAGCLGRNAPDLLRDPDFRKSQPVLQMLSVAEATLKKRAQAMVRDLKKRRLPLEVAAMKTVQKSGRLVPGAESAHLGGIACAPDHDTQDLREACAPAALHHSAHQQRAGHLDMRTLFPEEAD